MTCPNCGGNLLGDGYTVVLHCEHLGWFADLFEPDASPVFCSPDDEPTTPAQGEGSGRDFRSVRNGTDVLSEVNGSVCVRPIESRSEATIPPVRGGGPEGRARARAASKDCVERSTRLGTGRKLRSTSCLGLGFVVGDTFGGVVGVPPCRPVPGYAYSRGRPHFSPVGLGTAIAAAADDRSQPEAPAGDCAKTGATTLNQKQGSMPKIQFIVHSVRLNSFQGKRGFVEESVLTLIDNESDGECTLNSMVEYGIKRGSEEFVKFPPDKLAKQVVEIGVTEIEKFNGKTKIRGGKLLRIVTPGK